MKVFMTRVLAAGLIICVLLGACSQPPSTDQSLNNGLSPEDASSAQQTTAAVPSDFRATLKGRIDGKYEIQMDLEREGSKLKGTYFYQRPGAMSVAAKYIMLEGEIDAQGNAKLTETDFNAQSGQAVKTGEFYGKLTKTSEGDKSRLGFTGTWTRARDKRTMPFSVTEVLTDLGPALKLSAEKKEERNKAQRYDLETSLPRLAGSDSIRAAKFNREIDRFVSKQIGDFREFVAEESKSAAQGLRTTEIPNSLEVGHSITSSSDKHISILFTYFSYTGGAHPNTNTASLNYDLEKGEEIPLGSLFKQGSDYLKVISDYCITELSKLKVGDADWIRRGAGPKAENFKSWNITPQGLMITFDAYQVASYAEGPQEVVIPFSVLKPIARSGGLLWSAAGAAARENR